MYKNIILSIIPVCMFCLCGVSVARLFNPAIENPSFEATDLGTGGASQWVDYAEDWVIGSQGTCYLEDGSWEIVAPDGVATLKMWEDAAIWQQIGTWDRNIDYDIKLYVGRGYDDSAIDVELWAGGSSSLVPASGFGTIEDTVGAEMIVEVALTPTVTVGENELMSVVLNTGSGFNAGDALWLRIESTGTAVWVDNVSVAPVKDPTLAGNLYPSNAATDVPRDVVLSWTPGLFADKHDVYFGTNLEDISSAGTDSPLLVGPAQDANSFNVGRLEFGQEYFWRIDEINAPPDDTVFEGDIWSFTVEHLAYSIPYEKITASATSQVGADGPENTINRSGLDANDLHSRSTDDMWVSDEAEPGSVVIQYEFDKPYKLHQMLVWNYNGTLVLYGYGFKEVTIEYSLDEADWKQIEEVTEFDRAPGADGYAPNNTVDFNDVAVKYVRITANSNWSMGFLNQYGLSEVQFLTIPVSAKTPDPADEAKEVAVDVTLDWKTGREAVEHNLYLSTDQQAVADETIDAVTLMQAEYGPLALDLSSTYYWRVDEVNDAEIWQSDIWSFSTLEYLVVDDFESYNDLNIGEEGSNRVYLTWTDGYDNPNTNGSTMGYPDPDFSIGEHFVEPNTVHGGSQSAPLFYNNSVASYSEVTVNPANLAIGSDWSKGSAQTLVLWIYGNLTNADTEQLYVKIGNNKKTFSGNLSLPLWQQWNIDLTDINLSNITTMSIGVEGSSSGLIFIDDLMLYRTAPDVVQLEDPGSENIVARYEMENNMQDSSSNNLHATTFGTPSYEQGQTGYGMALVFDGEDDYVYLPIDQVMSSLNDCTITTWVNWTDEESGAWQRIFDFGTGTTANMFLTTNTGAGMRFAITTGGDIEESQATSSAVLPKGWHYIAVVIDSTSMSMELYLDGLVVASNSTEAVPADLGQTNQNWLGRSQYSADAYFIGSLDDFRIYNTALSEGQIRYIAGDR